MSRISGLRNHMSKRTFYKERKINNRFIHFLIKQNIKAPLFLNMYGLMSPICYQKIGIKLIGYTEGIFVNIY